MMAMEQDPQNVPFCGDQVIELLRAAEPFFRQGFVLGTKRLYGAYAPPHLRWGPEVYSMATGPKQSGPPRGPAKEACGKISVSGQSGGDDGHGIGPAKCSILRGPVGIELLRAAEPPFRQGFVLGTKRLYGAYAPPHLR